MYRQKNFAAPLKSKAVLYFTSGFAFLIKKMKKIT